MFLFSLSRSRSFVSSRNLSISEGEMIFFYEYRSFYEFVETFIFFEHHGIVYRILLNEGELLHGLFYSSIIRPTIIYYPFLGGKKRKGKEKLF